MAQKSTDSSLSNEVAWGSVRKVRFKPQIQMLIKYAVEMESHRFSKEDIRRIIEEDRIRRESIRLQVTQTGWRRALRQIGDRAGVAYKRSAEDTIAFAKGIGVFEIQDDLVVCPPRIKELYDCLKMEPEKCESELLALVLGSKYKAYVSFVINLQKLGGHFYIPPEFRRRTRISGFSKYLHENGFFTDIASFYTIRDFLYDFGLINWRIYPENAREHIFLTSQLVTTGTTTETQYARTVNLGEHSVLYERWVTENEFEDSISKHYLSLSEDRWGVIVELLELRDKVSEELCISDYQFNKLVLDMWKRKRAYLSVELSQGTVSLRVARGLLIKALNAPLIGDEIYATYIRLSRGIKK